MHENCLRCGSNKIIPDLPLVVDVATGGAPGGGTADVQVQGAPQAWFFKDTMPGGLTVKVCGECGHAELHAKNFRALYEKYESRRLS